MAACLSERISSPWLQGIVFYGVCFAVMAALSFAAPGFFGTDDYYHARISTEIITQGRLAVQFPWLPRTILSPERFTDHHLLYHLFIAPWTFWFGMVGAKLATASIAAGVFAAAWSLMRQIGVRRALLWALALFGASAPFLFRMLMVRTQGASLLLLIVALSLLFARRWRWLIPLAFAYAWLYNGFVLILAFAALYTLAAWIAEKRLEWQPLVCTAIGLALGLVINPYFPQNILFITDHLGAKVDIADSVRVGNEWYPYTTGALLENSGGALLALGLGLIAPSFSRRSRDRAENTLLFAALLTLFMVFRSRRFIEYYPAFALLFAAAAWGRGRIRLADWLPQRLSLRRLIPVGAVAVAGLFAVGVLTQVYNDARNARSPEYLAGASAWLRDNAPGGAMIFQTDWDDFTRLFYHNTRGTYLVGLDPTYLQIADPKLWDEWVDITQGRVQDPSWVIQQQFGAVYAVSDTEHEQFIEQANNDPNMTVVYQDRYNVVWQITGAVIASTRE